MKNMKSVIVALFLISCNSNIKTNKTLNINIGQVSYYIPSGFYLVDSSYAEIGNSLGRFYKYAHIKDTSIVIGLLFSERHLYKEEGSEHSNNEQYLRYVKNDLETIVGNVKKAEIKAINGKHFVTSHVSSDKYNYSSDIITFLYKMDMFEARAVNKNYSKDISIYNQMRDSFFNSIVINLND